MFLFFFQGARPLQRGGGGAPDREIKNASPNAPSAIYGFYCIVCRAGIHVIDMGTEPWSVSIACYNGGLCNPDVP